MRLRRRRARYRVEVEGEYLHAWARSEREAKQMAQSFLDFVERTRYGVQEMTARSVDVTPQYGDLGATPLGKSGQVVKNITRSRLPDA
jgi:hypothetical protein